MILSTSPVVFSISSVVSDHQKNLKKLETHIVPTKKNQVKTPSERGEKEENNLPVKVTLTLSKPLVLWSQLRELTHMYRLNRLIQPMKSRNVGRWNLSM